MTLEAKILALILFLILCGVGGFSAGYRSAANKYAAQQLAAERVASAKYRAEIERGNALSERLAKAESSIQTRTVEVIKYVNKVTTGRGCLSAGAVGLLNGTVYPAPLRTGAGTPAPDDAGPSASDTDVYQWIAEAQGSYDTCAARLNELIEWENGRADNGS